MENKTVLLLGGTGTLSTAVLLRAKLKGYKITIMNRGSNNRKVPADVDVVIGNFKNATDMQSKFANRKFDVVVDFLSRVPADIERVYPIFKDICQQYIFISSACVYQRADEDFPIKESSPKPNKDWSYNIEKYESELKLQELAKGSTSYYTIVRPYITYNEERIPLGITPAYKNHRTIIERIRSGKPWFVWDDGQAITTVTFTKDFAVGVVGLFLNPKASNEDFHVTSNFTYTQKEVAEKLFQKLNIRSNIVSLPTSVIAKKMPEYKGMLVGDRSLNAVFDNNKIKDAVPELEFKISLDEGLDAILAYWDNLGTYDYDYIFDAKIDKLLRSYGAKCRYIKYPNADSKSKIMYFIYTHFSNRVALKMAKLLNRI